MTIRGVAKPAVKVPHLVATDGSAWYDKRTKRWHTGWAWITTEGLYEVGSAPVPHDQVGPSAAVVTELRAVWHAVRRRVPERTAVVVLDSSDALHYLDAWARGFVPMPTGYVGSGTGRPMLHRLAAFVAVHHPLIAWSHVKGHNGHHLNEAADSLAKIGREWCRGTYRRPQAQERAHRLAEGFLADRRLGEVA